VAELRDAELPVGGIFVNMTRNPVLSDDELDLAIAGELPTDRIEAALRSVDFTDKASAITTTLVREGDDHARRVALERRESKRLEELDVPVLSLPYLSDGIDLASLYELAELLRTQGVR
jgi:hypothetical protein